jgi:3-hydroxyisobutyrate dehydrogenase
MTQTMARDTVAVLGAGGSTGFPVARSVAQAGIPLRVWDVDRAKAQPLADDGAYVAATPAEVAEGAGIVLTMLEEPEELLRLMREDVIPVMRRADGAEHAIWLQMARIGEDIVQQCIRMANRNGIGIVDAPLHGSTIIESGPEEARPRVQPVFDAIGQRTVRVGEAGEASREQPPG